MKFNLARSMDYSREPAINNNKAMDFFFHLWKKMGRNKKKPISLAVCRAVFFLVDESRY